MELKEILSSIVLIILTVTVLVTIFHYLKISTIIGFILSGILIGPACFKLIDSIPGAEVIAELTTVLLLFTVGLEFSFSEIKKMLRQVFSMGMTQVVLTTFCFMILLQAIFRLPLSQSFTIGFLLSLSSTAIMLKLLQLTRDFTSPYGTAVVIVNTSEDLATIPVILLIPLLATTSSIDHVSYSYVDVLLWLAKFTGICASFVVATKWILPFIFDKVIKTHTKELFIFMLAVLCFGTGIITNQIGMSLGLGGFLAGLMISESPFNRQAISDVIPFRDMILGIFFVSIGMLLDLKFLLHHIGMIAIFVVLLVIIKVSIMYFISRCNRYSKRMSVIISIFFTPTSELSLILAQTAFSMKVLTFDQMQYIISVSIITMAITPVVFSLIAIKYMKILDNIIEAQSKTSLISDLYNKLPGSIKKVWILRKLVRLLSVKKPTTKSKLLQNSVKDQIKQLKDHAIIIGYGVVGGNLAGVMSHLKIPHVIIEQNFPVVKQLQKKGVIALFGDATSATILEDAGLEQAKLVVVSVSGTTMSKDVVCLVKRMRPDVKIIARIQYSRQAKELESLHFDNLELVVAEYETTVELLAKCLTNYTVPVSQICEYIDETRSKFNQGKKGSVLSDYLRKAFNLPEWGIVPDIKPVLVKQGSKLIGQSLKNSEFRTKTGATIIAMFREGSGTFVPTPDTIFSSGDILHLLADSTAIEKVSDLLA